MPPLQDKSDSNNVIHIVDSFEFRGHLCICFELLSHNLYEFMRLQDFKRLNMQLVHKFATQLIHTLCFLKQEGVIHCDLKPENILLQNCHCSDIKVNNKYVFATPKIGNGLQRGQYGHFGTGHRLWQQLLPE